MAAVLVVGAALVAGDLVVVEAAVVVSGLNFISICRKEFPLSYDTDYDYLGRSLHTAAVWCWSRGSLNTDTRIVFEVSPIKFCQRRNCYETFQRNNHTRLDSEFGDLCCTCMFSLVPEVAVLLKVAGAGIRDTLSKPRRLLPYSASSWHNFPPLGQFFWWFKFLDIFLFLFLTTFSLCYLFEGFLFRKQVNY